MSDIAVRDNNNGTSSKAHRRRAVLPPIDVFENVDELLFIADVPGVANGGIELRIENGTLTLEAKRQPPKEESPALVREYEEVDFSTTLRIPAGIDTAAISAETKNGTLIVRLPKSVAAKPRKIVVH